MSLTLSSRELALLRDALTVTASPLAYASTSDWRAAVRHAVERLLDADKSVSAMVIDGEPYGEWPADDAAAWDLYVNSHFADEQGDRLLGVRGPEVACMTMVHDVPSLRRSELYNELVRPVFRASVELLMSFAGTRDPAYLMLVDALPEAAALCAVSGCVLHESPSLECLLAAEPRASHVRAAIAATARALASHTNGSGAKSAEESVDAPAAFEVRGAHRRYTIRGSRLATTPTDAQSAAAIVLVSSATPRAPSDAVLRKRFGLTAREVEVTRLLAIGRSAADVAATLGVSYYTARHHVEHVLSKLDVRSRSLVAASIAALADD